MKNIIQRTKGYTIIEFMVATTLATLMSIGVVSIVTNQTANLASESERDTTSETANQTFDLLSRLLRQAQKNTIQITYPEGGTYNSESEPEITSDAIVIEFQLPNGFNIWPNNVAPFNNSWVRLSWNNSLDDKYEVQITNAVSKASIDESKLIAVAGSSNGNQSPIINLDMWPMQDQTTPQSDVSDLPLNGYLLRVTTKSAKIDISYKDKDGDHYRKHTVAGIITPRN